MKGWGKVTLAYLLLLPSLLLEVCCAEPVQCQWGAYGDWSECDGCTKTQRRTRPIVTYAQFGGAPCSGESTQTQGCTPKRGCPLDEGCGDRFQCSSGKCISMALVCNGDQDCEEDALDEQGCEGSLCDIQRVPPNVELTGKGFDAVTGKLRGGVINTKSFGGQCRKVFSGDNRYFYRLPQSLVGYNFQVKIENDFSDEFYDSSWSYVKHVEQRANSNEGHHYKTFHQEATKKKTHRLLIVKNDVEVAQFQNAPPAYLPLSEEFWKALSALPAVYDYPAYRSLIERYGTHFLSEGTLGGKYQAMLGIDVKEDSQSSSSYEDYHRCVTRRYSFLFISWSKTECRSFVNSVQRASGSNSRKIPVGTDIVGGDPAYIAGLSYVDLDNPAGNKDMYTKWAGSVKSFPTVIQPKLRPLHELVKEVPCAALKRLHLKRATEEYQTEEHPCRCRPCRNNGLPVLSGTTCTCVCKLGTSGPACESGTALDEQPGVIHGKWTCWSAWSSCHQGQRSRTRTCSNPYPSGGGRHCNGESEERKACEDEDLEHLRTMEPHCFDSSLSPPKSCKTPPPLVNGIIVDPKDTYPVGTRVVYSCVGGFHITGDPTVECLDDLTWRRHTMECRSTVCMAPLLLDDVTGSPWKLTYQIGETITLSCPPGRVQEGASEIQCDSSLNWSPQPKSIKCSMLPTKVPDRAVECEPWMKAEKGRCVCKLPYECSLSLDVCATDAEKGRTLRLSFCKMQALICLGQRYVLAENSACQWPSRETASCSSCQPGETCAGETGRCRCKEPTECTEPGALLCVQSGEGAVAVTMSECETGLRRCKGEKVSVVGVTPCQV
ncbi:complement component C7 [Anguilla anguilla]|uniref:complement component C7 n=1 Tax=Anguilla anguilla TaxID=7936 RepID=UPI0015A942DB|nr:complement component C7 [Anguilla anguilla]XP_035291384.1 complement component C7 [Anguilla anguilla]